MGITSQSTLLPHDDPDASLPTEHSNGVRDGALRDPVGNPIRINGLR